MTYFGFGAPSRLDDVPTLLALTRQADDDGLDHFSVADHPYLGGHLDAYAAVSVALGATRQIKGFVNVTNLPTRPAPMLARTITSLSALTGGRILLGLGVGGRWNRITDLGVDPLTPGQAVDAFAEAITLIRSLAGGGPAVTHDGTYYRVHEIEPAAVVLPPIWTGSVGPRSLAVTGRLADGWIPGHAADWRSDRFRTGRRTIDDAAAAAGREPADIGTIFNLPGRITGTPLPAPRDAEGRWIGGSAAQWIEELTEATEVHHATGFTLFGPGGATPDAQSLSIWANEIAPAVRHISPAS